MIIAFPDVPISGFRGCGHYPECHQTPFLRQKGSDLDSGMKFTDVLYDVIGRHHQHQRIVRRSFLKRERRQRQGRRGIASDRLENDIGRRLIQRSQLLGDQKTMLLVAYQQRLSDMLHAIQTRNCLLQQCPLAHKTEQLFGILLARKRPQARARAA